MSGASEGAHHGHPDFRVGKSIFATIWPDQFRSVLRVPFPLAEALAAEDPANRRVVSKPGEWGWLSVQLEAIDPETYESFVREAWSGITRKPE